MVDTGFHNHADRKSSTNCCTCNFWVLIFTLKETKESLVHEQFVRIIHDVLRQQPLRGNYQDLCVNRIIYLLSLCNKVTPLESTVRIDHRTCGSHKQYFRQLHEQVNGWFLFHETVTSSCNYKYVFIFVHVYIHLGSTRALSVKMRILK